jgi:hypothetical protein
VQCPELYTFEMVNFIHLMVYELYFKKKLFDEAQ